jgi:hypothetical protein
MCCTSFLTASLSQYALRLTFPVLNRYSRVRPDNGGRREPRHHRGINTNASRCLDVFYKGEEVATVGVFV